VLPRTLKSMTLGLGVAALAAIAALGFGLLFGALTGWLDSLRTRWSESVADLLLLPADALLMIPAIPFVMMLAGTARASGPPGRFTALASIVSAALIPRAVRAYQTLWTAAPQEKRWLVRLLPGAGALYLGALFTALVTIVAAEFLGFGALPPTPTLGGTLVSGWRYMLMAPWLVVRPGVMLWLCLAAIYTAADALTGFFRTKEVLIRFNA
jgi:peptide/nickel transport system permease protein